MNCKCQSYATDTDFKFCLCKPYRVEVIASSTGQWLGNGLTFKTYEEAEDYAKDLFGRWTAVREWRVVQ